MVGFSSKKKFEETIDHGSVRLFMNYTIGFKVWLTRCITTAGVSQVGYPPTSLNIVYVFNLGQFAKYL